MGRTKELLLGLLGGGIGLFIAIMCLLSIPFNMIVFMRWFGLEWWTAFIAMTIMSVMPLIDQLAFFIFTFMGAYYLYQADFDWRKAASQPTKTLVSSQLSPAQSPKTPASLELGPAQFAEYVRTVLRPTMRRYCETMKDEIGARGKLTSSFCECYTRVVFEQTTQKDWAKKEGVQTIPPAVQQRVNKAVEEECLPKAFRRPSQ